MSCSAKIARTARGWAVFIGLFFYSFTALSWAADIQISNAEIRLPLPGQTTGVVYLELLNNSLSERTVTAVKVEGAGAAELHQHVHRDGMMRMRRLDRISVAAGATLKFESGSYHIMAFRMAGSASSTSPEGTHLVTLVMADGQQIVAHASPITL